MVFVRSKTFDRLSVLPVACLFRFFTIDTNNWEEIKQSGDIPSSRAAHSGVVVDKFIYIFGGMNFSGALNDLYRFDIGKSKLVKLEYF